jgi:UDP-N-acetylglucosamine 1-carboxyvinyltransferase
MLAVHSRPSHFRDQVFPNRFAYAHQLRKFGAHIIDDAQHGIQIRETQSLHGANVIAQDLRGGAALVITALSAQGESIIQGGRHINRGYEHLVEKLQLLGADISAVAHGKQSDALISAA